MDREQRLADTFIELADTLTDDFDTIRFLQRLAHRCVDLFEASAAALLLSMPGGDLRPAAASTHRRELSDLLATARHEGPVLECYRTGTRVGPFRTAHADRTAGAAGTTGAGTTGTSGTAGSGMTGIAEMDGMDGTVGLPGTAPRWPSFTAHARRAGYALGCALPLRLRQEVIGVLLLLRTAPVALPEHDIRLAQALADAATIGILHKQTVRRHAVLASQLNTALHSRITVEQAKGILAARWQITVDEAFEALRRHARSRRRLLTDVARDVVDAGLLPDRTQPPGSPDRR